MSNAEIGAQEFLVVAHLAGGALHLDAPAAQHDIPVGKFEREKRVLFDENKCGAIIAHR